MIINNYDFQTGNITSGSDQQKMHNVLNLYIGEIVSYELNGTHFLHDGKKFSVT